MHADAVMSLLSRLLPDGANETGKSKDAVTTEVRQGEVPTPEPAQNPPDQEEGKEEEPVADKDVSTASTLESNASINGTVANDTSALESDPSADAVDVVADALEM